MKLRALPQILGLILFLLPFQQLAHAGDISFVGNGGDGFVIDGRVYVTDLVMGGAELFKEPWVGKNLRPSANFFSLEHPLNTVTFPNELLGRKLNDLDQFWWGLGQFVTEAIRSHRWLFVDFRLTKTCDTDNNFFDLQNSKVEHVQIANRYNGEIRIQRYLWSQMNDVQKVALIVHEGIYSLLKKDSTLEEGSASCGHSIEKTRKIVRQVFSPNRLGEYVFDQDTVRLFNIDPNISRCLKLFSQNSISIFDKFNPSKRLSVDLSDFLKPGYNSKELLKNEISKICQKNFKSSKTGSEMGATYRIDVVRDPYRLELGLAGLTVGMRSNYLYYDDVTWKDSYDCEFFLRKLIPWYMDTRESRYSEILQSETPRNKCSGPSLGGLEL